jgi:hypothetical protein
MNTIQKLTKDCPQNNCSIMVGLSTMTCMGWTPTYDKNGNCTSTDPNFSTTDYRCNMCGKRWTVRFGGYLKTQEITEYK